MQRFRYLAGIAVLSSGLLLSACGGTHAAQIASNPQVRQNEAKAQKVVQGCVSHGNFLTHSGRQSILKCIAPPGQQAAFQRCTQKDIATGGFITKRQRGKVYQGLATCLENTR